MLISWGTDVQKKPNSTRGKRDTKLRTSGRKASELRANLRAPRAQPLTTDDLERASEGEAPIAEKTHPRSAMGFVIPSSEEAREHTPHHPSDSGITDFEVDRESSDAAADLGADLGAHFLEGAVDGQEATEAVVGEATHQGEVPYLFDESVPMHEESMSGDPFFDAEPVAALPRARRTHRGESSSR